ncbi:hypothetical protein [Pelagibius marinus]|uniref:hypothetical protein n=1 Tax=Pelagibius marinus TaxID=2762760 RepID=UPI0018729C51|nr:hypothetical protein [Pelagibius marinus]
MAAPASAQACKEIIAVAYKGSDQGRLTLRVNEVTLLRDHSSDMANFVPPNLLLEGENTLTIELAAQDGGTPSAKAEVFKGCWGEMPKDPGQNDNVLGTVVLDAPGSDSVAFTVSGLPAYSYLAAGPSDDAGLREAVADLIETTRNKDMEGYFAYLEPMVRDFTLDDPQAPEMLRQMTDYLFGQPSEVVDPGELTVTPVLGGRAFQVQDAAGNAPLQFAMSVDNGKETLWQAGIWMKTAGGWKVLRH